MNYYFVTPLKITHAKNAVLTYDSSDVFAPGQLVYVPLGRQSLVSAIVESSTSKPDFETKEIIKPLEPTALPAPLLKLALWMSNFYVTHPVTVWQSLLPRGLVKKRRNTHKHVPYPSRERTNIVLNTEQQAAFDVIKATESGTILLHGVTGSGKTQVYIESARNTIASGRDVIILVPEIALTSQLIAEFTPHFQNIIVTHSTMTESARHTAWKTILNAAEPYVIIGPRSALFSPVRRLGLIVIDECHEPSFKQEQSPRYSALRAAAMLAKYAQAKLILGSATPTIHDYYLAQKTNSPILHLRSPARPNTVPPTVSLVDMTKPLHFSSHKFFSNTLLTALKDTLTNGHQSLIFHNRRGTAPVTLCENCGWSALCETCFIPLTLHADLFTLQCHACGAKSRVPTVCPECSEANVIHKGIGTKLIYDEMKRLFPSARLARFDGDNTSDQTLDQMYQALYDGEIDIIIGTQVVAKGLDLPRLRLVGIIQADTGLTLPDYMSSERTFQLLAQACGRVGRNEHNSNVIVQSYQPQHPAVQYGISSDYQSFYKTTLHERRLGHFPPYRHLLKLLCIYKTESTAIKNAQKFARYLRGLCPPHVEVMSPTPAFYERVHDTYRWQIIVKSPVRSDLTDIVKRIPAAHWQYELDPFSLL